MKHLIGGIGLIMRRKDSRRIVIFATASFFLLLLISQNGRSAASLLSFDFIPLTRRLSLFLSTLFDIKNTFTASALVLAVLGSFLGGINLSLAYTYMKTRGDMILKSGLYSGIGLFFAFLGVGCAACGTAFLSVLLGFFGFSAMLNFLPYQGQEIGYAGLIFLSIATYALAKKVTAPNMC
jgi:hypothetical protein